MHPSYGDEHAEKRTAWSVAWRGTWPDAGAITIDAALVAAESAVHAEGPGPARPRRVLHAAVRRQRNFPATA